MASHDDEEPIRKTVLNNPIQSIAPPPRPAGYDTSSLKPPSSRTSGESTPTNPPNSMVLPPGAARELGGNKLVRLVGRGGMGEVWLGHDTRLQRDVAIKMMLSEVAEDPDFVARFYREARAVAKLNHPNIIQIYQIGEEGKLLFFAMEWVDGITVADRIEREGSLPLADALIIVLQAADALGYAHESGVIHRDIKPANLMLDPKGRLKVADFGLAKTAGGDATATTTGTLMGSPTYMSPEQAQGEHVDHRSDIYSLGVTLYQMLMGEAPFTSATPVGVLLKHVQEPLPEPQLIREAADGEVMRLIRRMTAKKPEERFQDYDELRAAVQGILEYIGAVPPSSSSGPLRYPGPTKPQDISRPTMPPGVPTRVQTPLGTPALPPKAPPKPGVPPIIAPVGMKPAKGALYGSSATIPARKVEKRSSKKVLVVAGVLLVLAGAGVGAVILLNSEKKTAPIGQINPMTSGLKPTDIADAAPSPIPTAVPPPPTSAAPTMVAIGDPLAIPSGGGRRRPVPTENDQMIRESPLGGILGTEFRKYQGAYRAFDFNRLVSVLSQAAQSPALAQRRATVQELLTAAQDCARARMQMAQAAAQRKPGDPPVRLKAEDLGGPLTLTGANGIQFNFRDSNNQEVPIVWHELTVGEVLVLSNQLLGPARTEEWKASFVRLYPSAARVNVGSAAP